jgi:hypothetical protein
MLLRILHFRHPSVCVSSRCAIRSGGWKLVAGSPIISRVYAIVAVLLVCHRIVKGWRRGHRLGFVPVEFVVNREGDKERAPEKNELAHNIPPKQAEHSRGVTGRRTCE